MKHVCDENGCRIIFDEEDDGSLKKSKKNIKKLKENNKK